MIKESINLFFFLCAVISFAYFVLVFNEIPIKPVWENICLFASVMTICNINYYLKNV